MTHSEDIKRVSTPETIDFLNARVEALERRVRLLEAKLEVEQQRQTIYLVQQIKEKLWQRARMNIKLLTSLTRLKTSAA